MGKIRFIWSIILLSVGHLCGYAYDLNRHDKTTTEQVMINTQAQIATETIHNINVDSIAKRQRRLMQLTTTLSGLKWMYDVTLHNAEGFGVESGVYKRIVCRSMDIAIESGRVLKAVPKAKAVNRAFCTLRTGELLVTAAHLGNLFHDIVTNATVANPMEGKLPGAQPAKKDKLNLLNRHERLNMAMTISHELDKILHQLRMMTYFLKNGEFRDLVFWLDSKTWCTAVYSQYLYNDAITRWNRLTR